MARGKVNKAAKIRGAFETLGRDARPRDVIAHLAKQRINVASAQVSLIKSKLAGGHAKNGVNGGRLRLADLLSAKRLVCELGSIQRAKAALEALEKVVS